MSDFRGSSPVLIRNPKSEQRGSTIGRWHLELRITGASHEGSPRGRRHWSSGRGVQ
ncbi:hypothetical protein U1Q18_008085, partial [Sarracenia purpurea var. burkii]